MPDIANDNGEYDLLEYSYYASNLERRGLLKDMTAIEHLVFRHMGDLANTTIHNHIGQWIVWERQTVTAAACGLTRCTVNRAIACLAQKGWLRIESERVGYKWRSSYIMLRPIPNPTGPIYTP